MVEPLVIFSRGIGSQRPWSAVGSGYGIFPKASGVCPVLLTIWPLFWRTILHRHRVTARHGRVSSAVSQHSSRWWAPLDTQHHHSALRTLDPSMISLVRQVCFCWTVTHMERTSGIDFERVTFDAVGPRF